MVLLAEFRNLNIIEIEFLKNTFLTISEKLVSFLDKNSEDLYVSIYEDKKIKPFPEIYYSPYILKDLINKFKLSVWSVGIYFGFIKRGEFYPSLEVFEFFDKKNLIPNEIKFQVNQKAEKSILYGNDIKKKMINSYLGHIEKNNFIIIYNKLDELIAIGYLNQKNNEINSLQENEIIALNLIDKGYFLRKQA